ncbi:BN159_2729 family protein [Streptomyces canus]|uniref:BN159_2729 family protein n=1 Tax=Streptomyces canus TaxID=58343 RepID=UPI0036CF39E7
MNSNLLHAAGVIRTVLVSVRAEQAAAVAHALDSARLLVDPERSFGVVLHRAPDGSWSRVRRTVTELERQALAWDEACARARAAARAVELELAGHPGPYGVRADGDRVRVLLRVDDPARWVRWRVHFGITAVQQRPEPGTVTGEGERHGVRVTVVARGAGTGPPHPGSDRAKRPFHLDGATYDLTLPHRDAYGHVWYFQGRRDHDGMPLMSLDGRPERCTLANVAAYAGPLTPLPEPTPAPTRAAAPARRPEPAGSRARNPRRSLGKRPVRWTRPRPTAGPVRDPGDDGPAVPVRPLHLSPPAASRADGSAP